MRQDLDELMSLSPAELRAMGECGRRLALERYDWARVVRPLAEFYRELVAGRP